MGERVVDTAAVQVKVFAEVVHGYSGAFDVPSGITYSPRAVPFQLLILEFGFGEPQNKVGLVALSLVLFNALSNAYFKVLRVMLVEDIVFVEL